MTLLGRAADPRSRCSSGLSGRVSGLDTVTDDDRRPAGDLDARAARRPRLRDVRARLRARRRDRHLPPRQADRPLADRGRQGRRGGRSGGRGHGAGRRSPRRRSSASGSSGIAAAIGYAAGDRRRGGALRGRLPRPEPGDRPGARDRPDLRPRLGGPPGRPVRGHPDVQHPPVRPRHRRRDRRRRQGRLGRAPGRHDGGPPRRSPSASSPWRSPSGASRPTRSARRTDRPTGQSTRRRSHGAIRVAVVCPGVPSGIHPEDDGLAAPALRVGMWKTKGQRHAP